MDYQLDYTRFAVRLRSPLAALTQIPTLGNDRLCVRVGHPEAIAFIRILPPVYGLVVNALEEGLAEPLNLQRPLAEILTMLATADGAYPHGLLPDPPPVPRTSTPRSRRPTIFRLK
jgi:hypothetical protein